MQVSVAALHTGCATHCPLKIGWRWRLVWTEKGEGIGRETWGQEVRSSRYNRGAIMVILRQGSHTGGRWGGRIGGGVGHQEIQNVARGCEFRVCGMPVVTVSSNTYDNTLTTLSNHL